MGALINFCDYLGMPFCLKHSGLLGSCVDYSSGQDFSNQCRRGVSLTSAVQKSLLHVLADLEHTSSPYIGSHPVQLLIYELDELRKTSVTWREKLINCSLVKEDSTVAGMDSSPHHSGVQLLCKLVCKPLERETTGQCEVLLYNTLAFNFLCSRKVFHR